MQSVSIPPPRRSSSAWLPVVIRTTDFRLRRRSLPVMKPWLRSFSAASQIFSTFASDKPLIPVRLFLVCIMRPLQV
uniref:Uncharacterized protein n=1 Tax=Arundo donax TaxID=35708 RepID=A0A0A9CZS8_ARUDO